MTAATLLNYKKDILLLYGLHFLYCCQALKCGEANTKPKGSGGEARGMKSIIEKF